MRYTVTGNLHKRQGVKITWQDGQLEGDESAVRQLQQLARLHEGDLIGPVGIYTENKHLESGLSAFFLMRELFDAITNIEGDIPEAPTIPDGAIG